MKANLEASGGLVLAEAVSFALAEKLGRAEAHELVAELTREAAKSKRPFKDVVAENAEGQAAPHGHRTGKAVHAATTIRARRRPSSTGWWHRRKAAACGARSPI